MGDRTTRPTAGQQLRLWWHDAPAAAPRLAGAAWLGLIAMVATMMVAGWVGFEMIAATAIFFVLPIVVLVASSLAVGALILGVRAIVQRRPASTDVRRGALAIALALPLVPGLGAAIANLT